MGHLCFAFESAFEGIRRVSGVVDLLCVKGVLWEWLSVLVRDWGLDEMIDCHFASL